MVILYTTHCPRCNVLEKKLNAKNISYKVCENTDLITGLGFTTAPVLDVGGDMLTFERAIQWLKGFDSTEERCETCKLN